ncbi:MAG: protein disulfide oxidoreductase, partial [Vulcanimicrobiota bacterium]
MGKYIDDKNKKEIQKILKRLPHRVKLVFFTQENACPMCREQQKLLQEVAELSDNIILEIYDLVKDGGQAMNYNISMIPATAVVSEEKDYGIRFFGLTAGYEFSSLLQTILMVSTEKSNLSPELQKLISYINEPINIKVMVTLTCPYCPQAVHSAHQLAMENKFIKAEMIDAGEFPVLSQKYEVSGVPKIIINEVHSIEGAIPPEALYLQILKAIKPEEYERMEETVGTARSGGKISRGVEGHLYELIVVGAGPAAISATIYASRKDLDVLMIGKKIGGQITYTGEIVNYLGLPGLSGDQMKQLFREHLEIFPHSRILGQTVTQIEKQGDEYVVITEEGKRFRGSSVAYCTGKEYKKLGVPGEEEFIGHGIAFCATCDAPLYRGKKVAVVGGGNSAFTAARDLINYASEIHLIHRREEYSADPALAHLVKLSDKVTLHPNMVVRQFMGGDRLSAIRLTSSDGSQHKDLLVDGVFLEIGLTPNTQPLEELITLNDGREIPVRCDNSTTLP